MLSGPPLDLTGLHGASGRNALAEVEVELVAPGAPADDEGDGRALADVALERAAGDDVHVGALLDGVGVDGDLGDVEEAGGGVEVAAGVEVDGRGPPGGGFGGGEGGHVDEVRLVEGELVDDFFGAGEVGREREDGDDRGGGGG